MNAEASVYDSSLKILGVVKLSYDTTTSKVTGFVLMDAANPEPLMRLDISRASLKGHAYWMAGSKKLIDGDIQVKKVGANYEGLVSNSFWKCDDFFTYPHQNGLGVK